MSVQALEECQGGTKWEPRWASKTTDDIRDDLCCDSYCAQQSTSKEYDKCCTCRSSTTWEGTETELLVEYVSVLGKSVVFSDQPYDNSKVYKIVFTDEQMTEFPSNLCNWDKDSFLVNHYSKYFEDIKPFWNSITTIDFRNKKIRRIPDINCLYRLDSLNLQNNHLPTVSNTSFTNLTRLRSIDFAGNLIKKIDPKIFTSPSLNLFSVDLSHNFMEKLDVSNMISLYPFCSIDFDSNKITELENQLNLVNKYNLRTWFCFNKRQSVSKLAGL
jgi:Leucine-rich repeat (LRR) protein